MAKGWYLIANPEAGKGLKSKDWEDIQETLKKSEISFQAFLSESKEHLYQLAKDGLKNGFRKFVAVGGDGTLHDLLNGLLSQGEVPSSELVLTNFPVGTGCDWSRMYGISRKVKLVSQLILKGKNVAQDIGLVSYQAEGEKKQCYFINVAGLGYDAYVVQKTQNQDKGGVFAKLRYLLTALKSLGTYQPQHTQLHSENFQKNGKALLSNVGLCRYSGGGMQLVPKAQPNDGLFELTFMEGLGMSQVLINLVKLYNGKLYTLRQAHHYRADKVSIEGKEPIPLEADGELLGTTPAKFELIPQAIQVRVPSSYKG